MSGTSDVFPRVMTARGGGTGVEIGAGGRAAYDDEESATLHAQYFDPAFGRRFAERALDALVVVRGARVLDVACDTGVFARLSAHVVGPAGSAVGIDPSAIAVAVARHIDPTSTVNWQQWDGGGLPFADGSFDVVACQHALHRFADPIALLQEMRRVLGPGGRLGITTWGPIEENPAFAAQLDATVKAGLDDSGVVESLLDICAWHRADDLEQLALRAGLVDASCQAVRMMAALPRVAEWVRVYPSLPPLCRVWPECDQHVRVQFLARATELLRPFEHDGVLRVQASSRLLVARRPHH
ncbi:MAG TPA: methyltransferase domain-containing protein [Acidimicrobiales bacterium]|jgi:ubiquinone/menaquinone biosynthesis C-methylase UbiE